MFPVEKSDMRPGEPCKKRNHPDGELLSSSLSKRYFTSAEDEVESSIHSDDGAVTWPPSSTKAREQLSGGKHSYSAVDSETSFGSSSSVHTTDVSCKSAGMKNADSIADGATRERRKSSGDVPYKRSWLTHLESLKIGRSDTELSMVTTDRTDGIDSLVSSDCAGSAESGISNASCSESRSNRRAESRYRREDVHGIASFSGRQTNASDMLRGARCGDGASSSLVEEAVCCCEEPRQDVFLAGKRLKYAAGDAYRPDRNSESAGFSDARRSHSSLSCETSRAMTMPKEHGQRLMDIRTGDTSKASALDGLETPVDRTTGHSLMGLDCNQGAESNDIPSVVVADSHKEIEEAAQPSYVLSSGRLSLEEEARLGRRAPTIDQDFEEYFAALML